MAHEQGLPQACVDDRFALEREVVERWFAGLGPESAVLDLGCGSGAWTALFAQRYRRVVGIEQSAAMVADARERLRGDERRAHRRRLPRGPRRGPLPRRLLRRHAHVPQPRRRRAPAHARGGPRPRRPDHPAGVRRASAARRDEDGRLPGRLPLARRVRGDRRRGGLARACGGAQPRLRADGGCRRGGEPRAAPGLLEAPRPGLRRCPPLARPPPHRAPQPGADPARGPGSGHRLAAPDQ
ncbi:MAG: class I SAM-dependent methyltransferase, partial [Chloroflexi bacterium]|nr:class I SAM-dependent methyltransferase [Chloroflexota bacterium]